MYPVAVVLVSIGPWWDLEVLAGLEGGRALELLCTDRKRVWCFLGCVTAAGALLQAKEKKLQFAPLAIRQ